MSAGPKLTEAQWQVLESLANRTYEAGERCTHFVGIQDDTGMDRKTVRRLVRFLSRRGFAEYHKGLWTEDWLPAGAGYCITDAGRAAWEARNER